MCRIVKHKWTLLHRVLEMGFNVLIMDVDFVVLRNPFVYFTPFCDLSFYDNNSPVPQDGRSIAATNVNLFEPNTGFLLFKCSEASKSLVSVFLTYIASPAADAGLDDQSLFFAINSKRTINVSRTNTTMDGEAPPVALKATQCTQWKGVSVRLLSSVFFNSWPKFYEMKWADLTQEAPYVIHYNFLSGVAKKTAMIKKHGHWGED